MEDILTQIKKIHLIGIGGIGMSGLALLLRDRGFRVSGSDICDSYVMEMLRKHNIEVYLGHRKENISLDTDLLVYSSAIKEDNPELVFAKEKGMRILKRAELLSLFCKDKPTIAVAGSHGKTTTTALLGYLFSSLGYRPTVCVGGMPLNYRRNAWWGENYFIVETDESDGSFLYFQPSFSIITNIDSEHLDYYRSMEKLCASFLDFSLATKIKVFGCGDDQKVKEIVSISKGISYGFNQDNFLRAEDFYFDGKFSCFNLIIEDKFIGEVKIPLLGEHNCLNSLAALGLFFHLGEDLEKVIFLLKDFKGTKRRFQVREKLAGTIFIDDYAHHPTEIKAVLKASRYLNPKKVLVIFQPHRFSRVKRLYPEFAHCFSLADELVITDIYAASEDKIEGIDSNFLLQEISTRFCGPLHYIPKEKLVEEVLSLIEGKDMVIALGAGDINILMGKIIDAFRRVKATY